MIARISVDAPSSVDAFGRAGFARHLAQTIERLDAHACGAVLGLEGRWGSGKTSVLNTLTSIVEECEPSHRPVLVRFNPWMVSGTNDLVQALLIQLASEIELASRNAGLAIKDGSSRAKQAQLAAAVLRYAGTLSAVKHLAPALDSLLPGTGLVARGIGQALETAEQATRPVLSVMEKLAKEGATLSLSQARSHVSSLLRQTGLRIVVLVDDLDRLPPSEIAAMVQAIKAVADFPGVVYVLAYDPQVTANALEKALQIEDGRAFLEKIIHVQLPLPEIAARKFHAWATKRLQDCTVGLTLNPNELADLDLAWPRVVALLRSPRDVERLRTRLLIALPQLVRQINAADLIAIETLSLSVPTVAEWVRSHVHRILRHPGADPNYQARGFYGDPHARARTLAATEMSREEQARSELTSWEQLPHGPSAVPVRNVLVFLFDAIPSARSYVRTNFRRLQHGLYWHRWTSYHDHQEAWEVSEIQDLLQRPTELRPFLNDATTLQDFCSLVCALGPQDFTQADAVGFAQLLSEIYGLHGDSLDKQPDGPCDAFVVSLRLDGLSRRAAMEHFIQNAPPAASFIPLRDAAIDAGEKGIHRGVKEEAQLFPDPQERHALLQLWFERIDEALRSPGLYPDNLEATPLNLTDWSVWLGRTPDEAKTALDRWHEAHPHRLRRLLTPYTDAYFRWPDARVPLELLPEPRLLSAAVADDAVFAAGHAVLLERLEAAAAHRPEAATPPAADPP